MSQYTIVATSAFGLESVVAGELKNLGYSNLSVQNGRVVFTGDEKDIARCNIWLRTADRVLIKVSEFKAMDFEELFQGTLSIPWEEMIPVDGKMHVIGKSVKSKLTSVKDCQAIVKKAIVEAMKRKHHTPWFAETGPLYKIEISLVKDIASITIDTSGAGLYKRGYREKAGEAPLRETLAAGLVLLSQWAPPRILADPLCGSGTIVIEAAMIGKNIAPGLMRRFAAEEWKGIPKEVWNEAREEAYGEIKDIQFRILASDIDGNVLKRAKENALRSGVGDYISFQKMPVEEFRSRKKYGCIICNPPYGERMGKLKSVEELYRRMGKVFSSLDTWSFFILSAHPKFEKFFGWKSDRKRKLYNGNIECFYYQYFGSLPRNP